MDEHRAETVAPGETGAPEDAGAGGVFPDRAAHPGSAGPGTAPHRGDPPPPRTRSGVSRSTRLSSRGEPYVWLTGSGLALALVMIATLLLLVLVNGATTFWPGPVVALTLNDGTVLLGEVARSETYRPSESELAALEPEVAEGIRARGGWSHRTLLRTGNFDLYGDDFRWVPDYMVASRTEPADAWLVERLEWGRAIGYARSLVSEERTIAKGSSDIERAFGSVHEEALDRLAEIRGIERNDIGSINHETERLRLAVRKAALEYGEGSEQHQTAARRFAEAEEETNQRYEELRARIRGIREEDSRDRFVLEESGGRILPESPGEPDKPMLVSQVVRAYPANRLSLAGRLGVYMDRWVEFLTKEPREANTEGGVFPAIFGTFMMTVIMSFAVAPFGVVAALYLREYARQGPLVSAVRIAVNNLAGVPSIVFGVFGLGFFCYTVGGGLDSLFFPEKLPSPTFGTGGILWASLTLALLTVPVVIVATEEAIAAVPKSMREGSYGCGASKWQTIRRVVLPQATPGIMTGLILAMARGAGEVAPLMITGVAKLAPELPFDSHFPWIHLERSFMHLGFHIYDVGFQSRNSEAGKPMVFTTTLLLIALVFLLNLGAIVLRSRLKRRFKSAQF